MNNIRFWMSARLHSLADRVHPWKVEGLTPPSAYNVGAGRFRFPVNPVSREYGRLGVTVEILPRGGYLNLLLVSFQQTTDYDGRPFVIPVRRGSTLCHYTAKGPMEGFFAKSDIPTSDLVVAGFFQTVWRVTACGVHGGLAIEGYAPDGAKAFLISTLLSDPSAWWA